MRHLATQCRLWSRTLLVLLLLFWASFANAQDISGAQTADIVAAPGSTARSVTYHLKRGDTLNVSTEELTPEFSVDLYVYNEAKQLVGKDDEESFAPTFAWQAPEEGNFYIVARNLSEGSGSIRIRLDQSKAPAAQSASAFAQIKTFFATDRQPVQSASSPLSFGTEPDPRGEFHLGECTVSIPRDHKMGELEGPSIFRLEFRVDPAKHVVLQETRVEGQSDFILRMKERLSHSEHKEVFVFVHGFNTTFEDAVRRTAQMTYDLGFDGPAVAYSWPSQGVPTPLAYNRDARNAELTVPHLQAFLNQIVARTGATTVHLVAHSMGNRPLSYALQAIAAENGTRLPLFGQIILLAPDVDAVLFQRLSQALRLTGRRVTLYASSRDEALELSRSYSGYVRAGQAGSHVTLYPGIDTIDASNVDTSSLGLYHQYYADSSKVLSDIFYVLRGTPAAGRFGLKRDSTVKGEYWEMTASAH